MGLQAGRTEASFKPGVFVTQYVGVKDSTRHVEAPSRENPEKEKIKVAQILLNRISE